jgi:hypothetical protein
VINFTEKVIDLTEKEVLAVNYLLDKIKHVPHLKGSLFGHLYDTFFLLKSMGASEETCLAGLYHSCYGTEKFNLKDKINKEDVVFYIGKDAEELVYYFSLKDRNEIILKNSMNLDPQKQLSLLEILYANELGQVQNTKYEFYKLHLNNIEALISKLKQIVLESK